MRVLGIESSCDETAVSVVEDGRVVLSNAVASQIDIHAKYGGVVPELASRNHIVDIIPTLRQGLDDAGLKLHDIDGFAATAGPGLTGSLLVGLECAKALAYAMNKPLVGVNHIEAHLTTPLLDYDGPEALSGTPQFPYVGLVVSGGHTHMYWVEGVGQYTLVGGTRDDAAGEAFDKVAKMMGLPYPGGVIIDKLALTGERDKHIFPRAMNRKGNYEFSFSGVKTAVLTHLKKEGMPANESQAMRDVCASFQEAVVDVLTKKVFSLCREKGAKHIVVAGGVSANSRLRERFVELGTSNNVEVHIPPLWLCTDNAAMIAGLGYHYLRANPECSFTAFDMNANSRLPLGVLPPSP